MRIVFCDVAPTRGPISEDEKMIETILIDAEHLGFNYVARFGNSEPKSIVTFAPKIIFLGSHKCSFAVCVETLNVVKGKPESLEIGKVAIGWVELNKDFLLAFHADPCAFGSTMNALGKLRPT
jgi:hypothetical protein